MPSLVEPDISSTLISGRETGGIGQFHPLKSRPAS